jgi:diguanylate cyclase (GGDEF)-like protein
MAWLWAITVLSLCVAWFALWRWRAAAREASTDSLTGLANRRSGRKALEREVQRASRYGRPLSVLLFDLDRFKAVNDRYGHPAGDRVLRAIAQAATKAVRDTDQVVRWGGEEFLVICAETGRAEASRLAERLRRRIARLHHVRRKLAVTASFGVTTFAPGEDSAALAERADQALYRAKRGGRNRVVSLPPPDQRSRAYMPGKSASFG